MMHKVPCIKYLTYCYDEVPDRKISADGIGRDWSYLHPHSAAKQQWKLVLGPLSIWNTSPGTGTTHTFGGSSHLSHLNLQNPSHTRNQENAQEICPQTNLIQTTLTETVSCHSELDQVESCC